MFHTFIARKAGASTVYLAIMGASSLFFALVFTVNMVYQATVVGLNPLQLVLVGTTLEAVAFTFEILTGLVADLYSRRLSVIIGFFLVGVGFLVEGSFPYFWAVLLAQVFWGIGYTFISGARDAWITDEVGEEKAGPLYLRAAQVGQFSGLLGTGASVALAALFIQLPILTAGILFLFLCLVLMFVMPESGFTPTPREERSSWQQMVHTARESVALIRIRPVLMAVMALSLIYGLYSEGFDRLWTPHLLDNFTFPTLGAVEPIVWFGLINAVGTVLSIGAVELIRRYVDPNSRRAVPVTLAIIYSIVTVGTVAFALAGNFGLALMALWTVQVARQSAGPLFTAWINQNVAHGVRATVLSAYAQLNALGQIGGGPAIGVIGTVRSLRLALAIAGLLLTPTLLIFRRTIGSRILVSEQDIEAQAVAD